MGEARHPAAGAARPANRVGLHPRRDLPAEGKGAGIVMPFCDTPAMQAHLAEIGAVVAPGAHALLILHQAAWSP